MASGNDHWNTPLEIWEPAFLLLGYGSGDPFWNPTAVGKPDWYFSGEGGFSEPWDASAFVNGPWSQQSKVVAKCVEEAERGHEIVMVQPSSVNAKYWPHILEAPAVVYPKRRISFLREGKPVKGNRTDVVLVYWGLDVWRFGRLFRHIGECVRQ